MKHILRQAGAVAIVAVLGLSLFGCQQQPPIAPGCDDSVPLNHRGDYHPENNGSAGH